MERPYTQRRGPVEITQTKGRTLFWSTWSGEGISWEPVSDFSQPKYIAKDGRYRVGHQWRKKKNKGGGNVDESGVRKYKNKMKTKQEGHNVKEKQPHKKKSTHSKVFMGGTVYSKEDLHKNKRG